MLGLSICGLDYRDRKPRSHLKRLLLLMQKWTRELHTERPELSPIDSTASIALYGIN